MKQFIFIIIGAAVVLTASSCSENPPVVEQEFSKSKSEPAPTKAEPESEPLLTECSGRIEVAPNHKYAIHARMNGIVRNISVREGELVKKGQVMAYLEHQDIIRLQEDFLKAKSEKEFLEKEFKRHQTLFEGQSISEREFEITKSKKLSANASFESLSRQLALLGISVAQLESKGIVTSVPIRSEAEGIVRSILIQDGSFVSQNSPLFELIDSKEKLVALQVYSEKAATLEIGQKIMFQLVGSEKQYTAKIARIGVDTDPQKNTVRIISEPLSEDSDMLIIGSRVFATFQ